ncbi:glycosyltransferase [Aureimonas sp. SK2]|uniref:glycosyltransferase n=1 Tax=Aureimonas sp. SK2 TaxID=3015992 RepID=UPI002444AD3A|nr:glycosyltransferase [Aureimonas sp. SK2]
MDWTELLRADPALAIPERHAEALTRAAARRFREGAPQDALALLRRRMRLSEPPAAAERALLALVASAAGSRAEAETALAGALDADPLDPATGLIALRLAAGPDAAIAAARRIFASPVATDEALAQALSALFIAGEEAAVRFDLCDGRLTGWAVWRGPQAPVLSLHGPQSERRQALVPWPDLAFLPAGASGARVDVPAHGIFAGWRLERDGRILAHGPLHARSRTGRNSGGARPGAAPRTVPERRPVRVVMPVHGDLDATREALRAAVLEAGRHPGARLVVVDDRSPVPEIVQLVETMAERNFMELRRTPANLGFPGAVALGLEGMDGAEDALVLNADALLPAGAIARLADAVYGAPDIGTATPLSNNGEWTSWPRLGQAAPLPSPPEAARLDATARRLALDPVDLPNGIGFALFVRHDCLAAIGAPSAIYERGYFEDLEWTLEAARAGFRNVAAPGLFVPHHGSRSFGADKAMLVARNLRRLRRRYPAIRAASAAFRAADPLRIVRARLEEACPPAGRPALFVGPAGSPTLAERLYRQGEAGGVVLRWRRAGAVLRAELAGLHGAAPQSLGFDAAEEPGALAAWLAALDPARIELAGPPPPPSILDALLRLNAPFAILAGDPMPDRPAPLAQTVADWRSALGERSHRVLAQDGATLAVLRRQLADDPAAEGLEAVLPEAVPPPSSAAPAGAPARIGLLMGVPSPASLAFAAALDTALRARAVAARLEAIGASLDDLALLGRGIGASGPLEPGGHARIAAGATALVLPPADPSLALFERVLAETGLPGACLDWSDGALESPSSLHLLPRNRDERDTVQALVDWIAGRLAA